MEPLSTKITSISSLVITSPNRVKGNRQGRPLFDVFFTAGMSLFETCYLHMKLYDINAQPNLFPRTFYESWENPPYDFSLDLYALYMAQIKGLPGSNGLWQM